MPTEEKIIVTQRHKLVSAFLKREVRIDIYLPSNLPSAGVHLLLINDGQDLPKMPFDKILSPLLQQNRLQPLVFAGIHAGEDRKVEFGTSHQPDYEGRGAKAAAYAQFVVKELLPYLQSALPYRFASTAMAGFSLGGLMALDIVWNYPELFTTAGVFSGSLWWRSRGLDDGYDEDTDRIMHQQVKEGKYQAGQRFYFTTGSLDETADRNKNGIIDSIDDTQDLIEELKKKGYNDRDIAYINYEDGRHDVETWARALPAFLQWGWARSRFNNFF